MATTTYRILNTDYGRCFWVRGTVGNVSFYDNRADAEVYTAEYAERFAEWIREGTSGTTTVREAR